MIAHGAGGAVGSIVTQLARELGAYVIGTGRAGDRDAAIAAGANEFVDLERQQLEDVGEVDLIFDTLGGEIGKRSARLVRGGGVLISIVGPADERRSDGRVIDFVVEPDRDQLGEIVRRVRDGRLRNTVAAVVSLEDAIPAFNSPDRRPGKTVIRIHT
jgi:NADPH:quinone reductase-like Zn-dependent oxidoreductase